mmetsp:Transcript_13481/g.32985  ORF Transcript_13481/g.32985 Transcript_13481/m.32985 type:complete len:459 (+) Transcript_13481:36-1412(+)|eukprot:CAMPEP_0206231838 /NCGR_PEP_ID=MMETSP0047_2-20121206/11066_1 /ASSEMBLY_ACC=CAM_ASM_000192 /TAXON_ID=195065 /ORGANISM="Chroomonas mesostigmatica_cf, Strain CCMP1168" /LENGTH=458 /DNA_ID=CAMNT_0053655475 /DNA_START=36 /DNA_END=1412 /DNA_ORIENTATION=-
MRGAGCMAARTVLCLLSGLALAAAQCDPTIECCTPGTPQLGDDPRLDTGSFCTDKPFESSYLINIGTKVPMLLNFVDYCTDEIIYTSRFVVEVDRFSVVNIPCTYDPAPCSTLPEEQKATCNASRAIWTDPNGQFGCSGNNDGFWDRVMLPRICNAENFGRFANTTDYIWRDGRPSISSMPEQGGFCRCNRTTLAAKQGVTNGATNLTGVPDGFIKAGMSTFYTQVVIGARKTSDPENTCQCSGIDDTSPECMCMLGTKKVPYVYNNSYVPYFTALISIRNGGLLYQNTWIKWNFDSNGIGCVGCPADNCWGTPMANLEGWVQMGRDLMIQDGKMCAVASRPDPNDAMAPYCMYPASEKSITPCSLKVYIAWVGTDGFNQALQSSNEMFSRFTQMGVSSMAWQFYTGASNLVTDITRKVAGSDTGYRRLHKFRVGFANYRQWFARWFGFGGGKRDERM